MSTRSILITGGAGFIGSRAAAAFITEGWRVGVLDDFNDFYDPSIKRANLASLPGKPEIFEGDICDEDAVERAFKPGWDVVLHVAARAGVRPSIARPEIYVRTNVLGTLRVLEAAAKGHAGKFLFASSSSVYGAADEVPFRESAPLRRTFSPYAATKVSGEQLCSVYSSLHNLPVVSLRFFTVYGPGQRPDLAIHKFTRAVWEGRPIPQYGDGSSRRDYTYVDDIVQGIRGAVGYDGAKYDVFNLGESETTTLSELIVAIESALGKKAVIERKPDQPGDMPATWADISKARQLLGYAPKTKISEGIPKFVDWFRATVS
ncbi:MAG: GDP-mannose 4,6-dehydratase [Chthoniobacterales bacterium]|nr:GDP-mannose 4,6-dehydratase [Chthoniobacterales bacterium]